MSSRSLPSACAFLPSAAWRALAAALSATRQAAARVVDQIRARHRLAMDRSEYERLDAHVLRDLGVSSDDFAAFHAELKRRETDRRRRDHGAR